MQPGDADNPPHDQKNREPVEPAHPASEAGVGDALVEMKCGVENSAVNPPTERVVGVCCSWPDATGADEVRSLLRSLKEIEKQGLAPGSVLLIEVSAVCVCDTRLVACLLRACAMARKADARLKVIVSGTVADWLGVCGVGRIVPHSVAG